MTPELKAKLEAARAFYRRPDVRADEIRVWEILERGYRQTGRLATTGDGASLEALVAFRRFVASLRRERERQGLSLADLAERAGIDKATLNRIENGRCNPTVNTLARHVEALGKVIAWGLADRDRQA
jgi:ribosome-binding protein aMBF1 (putative translation factor)